MAARAPEPQRGRADDAASRRGLRPSIVARVAAPRTRSPAGAPQNRLASCAIELTRRPPVGAKRSALEKIALPPHEASSRHRDIVYPAAAPFLLVHLGCLAVIWTGVTWSAVSLGVALYLVRMFGIGAGYHRYFSHRAFATGRGFQFALAALAQSSAQSSVLWWASRHRHHHRHSDTEEDTHSALRDGFWYSHIGWIFDRRHRDVDLEQIDDLARFPELLWLHRHEFVPAVALAAACFALAGWSGLVVGFLWSTVGVYHSTFCINSLAHMTGSRRYVTGDGSRNNVWLALLTLGEGWHNNHHACQSSARQGFRWWEIDPTFYGLWILSKLGMVWDLKAPPAALLRNEHRLGARVVDRAAAQLLARLDADPAAQSPASVRPRLEALALDMFARTSCLGRIVARAHHLIEVRAGAGRDAASA